MKKIDHYFLLGIICISLQGCFFIFQPERRKASEYTPITMTRAELNQSVKIQAARALRQTGKIYVRTPYLFINDKYEGVHIIDNTNPANPQKIAFIAVPGCLDMAVKGNSLYVDNAIDLVTINISNPSQPQFIKRIESVFPINVVSPDGYSYDITGDKIIVGWTRN